MHHTRKQVELQGPLHYGQEDEDVLVLRVPDSAQVDSPITKRSTEFKNYDDLITGDERLKKEIEDKYLTEKPTDLNIDYSNYENFINFSSAEKRLKNFTIFNHSLVLDKILN